MRVFACSRHSYSAVGWQTIQGETLVVPLEQTAGIYKHAFVSSRNTLDARFLLAHNVSLATHVDADTAASC